MIEANRRVSILVGLLVVAVGVTLAAILVFLGSATRLFGAGVRVSACFSDVTGLRPGASVLISGVSIGSVSKISLGGSCGERAQVKLVLDGDAAGRLSSDTRARLVTMGLLGDRLVLLTSGNAEPRLRSGAVLEGQVPPDPSAVIARVDQTFEVLARIFRRVDDTLAGADLDRLVEDLHASLRSLRSVLDRAERGPGLVHLLVYDRALQDKARLLVPALEHVARATQGADQLVGRLDRAGADLAEIVAYVKSGQGTLGGVIYDPAIYEDLRSIVGRVRRSLILRVLGRFVLKHQ